MFIMFFRFLEINFLDLHPFFAQPSGNIDNLDWKGKI